MKILFLLFMTDFILTFLGIDAGIIEEANPFLIWLFELPFIIGLIIRLFMFFVVMYIPIKLMEKYKEKVRAYIVKSYYGIAFSVNALILGMHLYWIVSYAIFTYI